VDVVVLVAQAAVVAAADAEVAAAQAECRPVSIRSR
jgi:hypothetical protein